MSYLRNQLVSKEIQAPSNLDFDIANNVYGAVWALVNEDERKLLAIIDEFLPVQYLYISCEM